MAIEQQDFNIKHKVKLNENNTELKMLKKYIYDCEKNYNCNDSIYTDIKNRIKLLEKVSTTTQWYL
jgi:hypothetical protein